MAEKKIKIVLSGGGTGGHVFPLVAVAREIKRMLPEKTKLFYVGPKDRWIDLYLSEEEVKVRPVMSGKVRRYINPRAVFLNFIDFFKIILGTFQAFFKLFFVNPDLIFSKGGYGSIPVIIAGKILQVPIFNHESDKVPGVANRFASRLALRTFTSFPNTEYLKQEKIILTGNPIRREILEGTREESTKLFDLSGERPILLVFPGSQGSQRINDLILLVLPALLEFFEIIHQCGSQNYEQVKKEAEVVMESGQEKYYHPYPFLNEKGVREALFAADLVISRAGSGNIFEAAAAHKPLVLIPLPESAQNHQYENAYHLKRKGAAMVLEERNLTPQFFVERIIFLLTHENELEKMRKAIAKFAKPKAAKKIAHYLLEYLLR